MAETNCLSGPVAISTRKPGMGMRNPRKRIGNAKRRRPALDGPDRAGYHGYQRRGREERKVLRLADDVQGQAGEQNQKREKGDRPLFAPGRNSRSAIWQNVVRTLSPDQGAR